jgi:transcriptional regulator with XRE-family HTH domain
VNSRTVQGALVAGANIRRTRDANGLSLSALARRSGVAKATLSALESGSSNPTVATLESIAEALGVTVAQLLVSGSVEDVRVLRATEAEQPGTDDRLVESFAPPGLVEIFDIRYEAGTRIEYPAHDPGFTERVLVHEGCLRVGPTGETVELVAGDYAVFQADRPHTYEGLDGTVRGILIALHPTASRGPETIHGRSRE